MSHQKLSVSEKNIPWVALMWLSWFGMWVLYIPLYLRYGALAGLLGVVPVGLCGGLAGRRVGVLAAMVAMGTQATSLYLLGYPVHVVHEPSLFFAGMGLFLWVGFSLGQMHYLGWRLQGQLRESEARKKALEEMEARHRSLLYALPDCLFHVSEDARVRDALSWREVFDSECPAERPWPKEIDERMWEKIDLVLTSRVAQQLEYQVSAREDGAGEYAYEAKIVAIHPEEALVILRDITRHKRLEQKLQEAHEGALLAAQERSDFLARMSHEIRTPLHGMLTALELLQNERRQLDDKELLKIVRESGLVLQELVNEILDFSKLEAGRIELEQIRFHLPELIESILAFFWPQAHAKSLRLLGMLEPDVPLFVLGDSLRLRQVLMNLIANALKFTPHGEVSLHVERLGDHLRFSVRDSGIGIEQEALSRLFQVFEQASSSTSRNFGGTGLGLVIAKQLTELMGGTIDVSSMPNMGSCFAVWIPLQHAKDEEKGLGGRVTKGHVSCEVYDTSQGLVLVDEKTKLPALIGREAWSFAPRVLWVDRHTLRGGWAVRLLSAWGCDCEGAKSLDEAEARLLWSEHEPTGVALCWIETDGMEEAAWSWLGAHIESPVASQCAYVVAQSCDEPIPRWASMRSGLFVLSRWARQEEMRRVLSMALSWQMEQRIRLMNGHRRSSTEIRRGPFPSLQPYTSRDSWEEVAPEPLERTGTPSMNAPGSVVEEDASPTRPSDHKKVADTFMHRGRARRESVRKREVHWIVREFVPNVENSLEGQENEPTRTPRSTRPIHFEEGVQMATTVAVRHLEKGTKKRGLSEVEQGLSEGWSEEKEASGDQGHPRENHVEEEEFATNDSTGGEKRSIITTRRLRGGELPHVYPESTDALKGRDLYVQTMRQKEKSMDKITQPPSHWDIGWETSSSHTIESKEPLSLESPRILVVEDNVLNQRVMTLTLERLGYAVEIATNGQEALLSLQRKGDLLYTAILMDCQMPELDGYQTTTLIRQRFPKTLPIIGMSASHLEEDRQRALTAGMDDYLAKPVRQENLDRVLSYWCHRKSHVPSSLGGITHS